MGVDDVQDERDADAAVLVAADLIGRFFIIFETNGENSVFKIKQVVYQETDRCSGLAGVPDGCRKQAG